MNINEKAPPVNASQLLSKAGIDGHVEKLESGAINDIVIFSDDEGKKALRCRTREHIFGYEKGFFKEPLISAFLAVAKPFNPEHNELVMDAAVKSLLSAPVGGASHTYPLPKTISYDSGKEKMPFLWMVQEYAEGKLLLENATEKEWYKLGQEIGRLHSMQLEKSGPLDNRTQTPGQRIQSLIDDISKKSPVPLTRSFNAQALSEGKLSLCHGDVHGQNVIVGKSTTIIDWDNAVVDFPELDLVKPLHWCAADAQGFFTPHEAYYAAYLKGHENTYDKAADPERLKLYELSWLCRVYQFEEQRESSGRVPAPPAPPAKSYLDRIKALANGD